MPHAGQEWAGNEYEERRRGQRYEMRAELMFRWQVAPEVWRTCKGVSKDISGHGISVISSSILVPGAAIEVVIHLPVAWSETACLRGTGVVLRLLPETGQPWGFAASLDFEEEIYERYWEEAATRSFCDDQPDTSKSYDSALLCVTRELRVCRRGFAAR
jgi:hypothetical protein